MSRAAALALAAALASGATAARAQTMLDQEERLIDIHSLLLDLPPVQAPGALEPGRLGVAVEGITIPDIDGTTGSNVQLTASDRTPLFPRPRVALGLPAPERFRAFVGLAYIPPLRIREVSTHHVAGEAGLAFVPGALRAGARVHALYAESTAPVTERFTRDRLETRGLGADVSAGWRFALGQGTALALEPYAGAGVVQVRGRFRVTSDATVLRSRHTGAALHGGARLLWRERWEGVVEVDGYPGRLVHTSFRLGYLLGGG